MKELIFDGINGISTKLTEFLAGRHENRKLISRHPELVEGSIP
jgi:hypothetical protein